MGVFGSWLDCLSPPFCALCRQPPGALPWMCDPCLDRFPWVREPCCHRCGRPRALATPVCDRCPPWPARLYAVRAAASYGPITRRLTQPLLAPGGLATLPCVAALAISAARRLPQRVVDASSPAVVPVVVPVPLHPRTRRRRGIDGARELAAMVARAMDWPLRADVLRRVRAPATADEVATVRGHWRRTAGSFRAVPMHGVRSVVLVDVVWRTGATLDAAARALGRRGVIDVAAVAAISSA